VRAETSVPASPETVWPALADATAWPSWFSGMKDAHYTSPQPYGVGSTRCVRVMSLVADETILAFDVGRRFAFRVDSTNLPLFAALVEVVTLEAVGGTTRVVYRQALEPKPWLRLLMPLVRGQMERVCAAAWRASRPGAAHRSLACRPRWLSARWPVRQLVTVACARRAVALERAPTPRMPAQRAVPKRPAR
jgi:uncharacterized protein YndB with AHSA1/START domain